MPATRFSANPDEVFHVAQGRAAFEQHHLEAVVEQRHVPGDREIAAVIPDLADQRERAAARLAVDLDVELGEPLSEQAPAGQPVGQLARSALSMPAFTRYTMWASRPIPAISRKCRETRAAVAGHVAQRNAARPQVVEALRRRARDSCPSLVSTASTLAVPPGSTASGIAECAMPSAISLIVPSPPAATTSSAPRAICSRAIAPAVPRTRRRRERHRVRPFARRIWTARSISAPPFRLNLAALGL